MERKMKEYQNWLLTAEDHTARVTLNRADQSNNLPPEVFYELRDISHELSTRDDIWVVVMEGAGRHFSVGLDFSFLGQMVDMGKDAFGDNASLLLDCLNTFDGLEKPTIARLHGFCLGGGMVLALCCDFRIAARRTVLGFPEVKRGLVAVGGTHRLVRTVGLGVAKELLLLGENITAQRALELRLVHQVVPDDELDKGVNAMAKKFYEMPPRTVGLAKVVINQGHDLSMRDSEELELELQKKMLGSADFEEAIKSFLEERPPSYTGR
jgi:enoyl-CoA hydratase/carnithine racemase